MNCSVYSSSVCQHQKIAPKSECLAHMITSNSCPAPPYKYNLIAATSGPHCPNLTLSHPTSRSLLKLSPLLGMPSPHISSAPDKIYPSFKALLNATFSVQPQPDSVSLKVRIIFFPLHSQPTTTMILYFIWALIPALAIVPLSVHISVQPCQAHPLLSASGSLPTA